MGYEIEFCCCPGSILDCSRSEPFQQTSDEQAVGKGRKEKSGRQRPRVSRWVALLIALVGLLAGVVFAVYPLASGNSQLRIYNWAQFCGGMLTIVTYAILYLGLM